MILDIFVPGVPKPAGSKNAVPVFNRHTKQFVTDRNGRPVVQVRDSAGPSGSAWSDTIAGVVGSAWKSPPIDEPVALVLEFTMPRPKHHFGRRNGVPYLKPGSPVWHTSTPDTTKLVRRAEDALSALGLWRDDCLVVEQYATKVYGDRPGVRIQVRQASAATVSSAEAC
jgi:Holliday junction resolvase RusA-like endonuclease